MKSPREKHESDLNERELAEEILRLTNIVNRGDATGSDVHRLRWCRHWQENIQAAKAAKPEKPFRWFWMK